MRAMPESRALGDCANASVSGASCMLHARWAGWGCLREVPIEETSRPAFDAVCEGAAMKEGSPCIPSRHRVFRGVWFAAAVVNLAIWMQTVGAAWIMTTLSSSPLMVSLVQTAMTLPVFLFGLPGGVIADLVDRRRWL